MSEPVDEQYFLRVEKHFGRRRGGPLVLSPNDWGLLESWQKQGIPLRVVLRGINQSFDRFAAAGRRSDRINSLRYCEQEVQAAWQEHRAATRRPDGDDTAPEGLPAASQHLNAVAAACRAAAGRLRPAAASCLLAAIEELEQLERLSHDGGIDAREIDRRSTELENRVHTELRELAAEDPCIGDLKLPRFSPYEAF